MTQKRMQMRNVWMNVFINIRPWVEACEQSQTAYLLISNHTLANNNLTLFSDIS